MLCLPPRTYERRSNNLSMTIKQATDNVSRHSRVRAVDHDDDDDDAGQIKQWYQNYSVHEEKLDLCLYKIEIDLLSERSERLSPKFMGFMIAWFMPLVAEWQR